MKVFLIKIIKNLLNQNNISFYRNINNEKLIKLIRLFRPYDLGYDLIRVGDDKDGGYLIPNCLEDIKFCFSVGVDNKFSFEENLFKRGIKSFLSDYSQDISKIPDIFEFEKKNIKSFNGEKKLLMPNIIVSVVGKLNIYDNETFNFLKRVKPGWIFQYDPLGLGIVAFWPG